MDELIYFLEKMATPLIAAFIGAVLAFRYQRTLELKRDKRVIIQNLMIYRNVGAEELDWIKALNAIDVVFSGDTEVKRLFHKFLSETRVPTYSSFAWVETFYEMIFEMAKCSDYKTLSMQDIREFYSPEALMKHYPNLNDPNKPTPPQKDSVSPPVD